jgi:hypothetical protein
MKKIAAVVRFAATIFNCTEKENSQDDTVPDCLTAMIRDIKSEDVWNPPAKVRQYHYGRQTVYYIPPRCCDMPGILMNRNCDILYSPDGGFTGKGDGKYADFFEKRTDSILIREDTRTDPR